MTQAELDNCRMVHPMMTVTQCQEWTWSQCQQNQCYAECLAPCDDNDWDCRNPCYETTCNPCQTMCDARCTEVIGDVPAECLQGCFTICNDFNSDHSGKFFLSPTSCRNSVIFHIFQGQHSRMKLVYYSYWELLFQFAWSKQSLFVQHNLAKFHHLLSHLASLLDALIQMTVMVFFLLAVMEISLVMNPWTLTAMKNVSQSIVINPMKTAIKDVSQDKPISTATQKWQHIKLQIVLIIIAKLILRWDVMKILAIITSSVIIIK